MPKSDLKFHRQLSLVRMKSSIQHDQTDNNGNNKNIGTDLEIVKMVCYFRCIRCKILLICEKALCETLTYTHNVYWTNLSDNNRYVTMEMILKNL